MIVFDDAIRQLSILAILVAPNYVRARWNLAFAFRRSATSMRLVSEYREAIRLATQDPEQRAMLHTFLGDTLRARAGGSANLEGAILEYQRAIEIISSL